MRRPAQSPMTAVWVQGKKRYGQCREPLAVGDSQGARVRKGGGGKVADGRGGLDFGEGGGWDFLPGRERSSSSAALWMRGLR